MYLKEWLIEGYLFVCTGHEHASEKRLGCLPNRLADQSQGGIEGVSGVVLSK